jgi:hypothetical protein
MLCVCEKMAVTSGSTDAYGGEEWSSVIRIHWLGDARGGPSGGANSHHSTDYSRTKLPEHVVVGSRVCAIALAADVLVVAEDACSGGGGGGATLRGRGDGMQTPPGSPGEAREEYAIVSVRSVATGAVLAVFEHSGLVAAVDIVSPSPSREAYVVCIGENEEVGLGDDDGGLGGGVGSPSSPSAGGGYNKADTLEIGRVTIRALRISGGNSGAGHKMALTTSTTSVTVLPAIQSQVTSLRLSADGSRVAVGAGKHVLLFRHTSRRRQRRSGAGSSRHSGYTHGGSNGSPHGVQGAFADATLSTGANGAHGGEESSAAFVDEWEMEFGTALMRFTTNVTQLSSAGGADEMLLVSLAGGLCSHFEWQLLSLDNTSMAGGPASDSGRGLSGRKRGAQPSVSDAFRIVSAMLHAMPNSNYRNKTAGDLADQDALSPRDMHRHRSARRQRGRSGSGVDNDDASSSNGSASPSNIPALRYRKRVDSFMHKGGAGQKGGRGKTVLGRASSLDAVRENHHPSSPMSAVLLSSPPGSPIAGRRAVHTHGAHEQQLWDDYGGVTSLIMIRPAEMDWAWAAQQMLTAYPELVSAQDAQGSTLLHIAVNQCIHESEVLGVLELISSVVDPADVGFVPDKDGKTALQLAVDRRYPRAVEHLLRMCVCGGPRSRKYVTPSLASLVQQYPRMAVGFLHSIGLEDAGPEVWSTKLGEEMIVRATPTPFGAARLWAGFSRNGNPRVPVIAKLIGLEGLTKSHEVMHALAAGGKHGSTSMHLELFETDIVRVLLQFKWMQYGLWIHCIHMGIYICFLVAYSCWLYRVHWAGQLGEDIGKHSFDEMGNRDPDLSTVNVVLGAVAIAFALLFLVVEGLEFAVGPRGYINSGWNLVDCASVVLVLTSIGCWFAKNEDALWVSIFATPLTYIRSLNFLRGFRATGALVSIISEVVVDVLPFCLILIIVVATFGASFFLLGEFYHKSGSMFKTYIMLLGEFWADDEEDEFTRGTSRLFFWIFTAVASVMMLNLLIAIICDTYERVKERELPQFLLERLRILCRIEKIAQFLALDVNLAFQLNTDPWLHVLMPTQRIERASWSGRLKMLKECTADHAVATQERIGAVESDLGQAIHSLRQELQSGVGGVRKELGARQARMEAQLELLVNQLVPGSVAAQHFAQQPQRTHQQVSQTYSEHQHLEQQRHQRRSSSPTQRQQPSPAPPYQHSPRGFDRDQHGFDVEDMM